MEKRIEPTEPIKEPTDAAGLAAARAYAGWHLGQRSWADSILWAYLNPVKAQAAIKAEKES